MGFTLEFHFRTLNTAKSLGSGWKPFPKKAWDPKRVPPWERLQPASPPRIRAHCRVKRVWFSHPGTRILLLPARQNFQGKKIPQTIPYYMAQHSLYSRRFSCLEAYSLDNWPLLASCTSFTTRPNSPRSESLPLSLVFNLHPSSPGAAGRLCISPPSNTRSSVVSKHVVSLPA